MNKTISVEIDDIVIECANAFDYSFDGTTCFEIPSIKVPADYNIGLIVGPSGSGKSTILKSIGNHKHIEWNESKAICSHFASAQEAKTKLGAVGLNSVPTWMKPFHVLSTGEQFRANLARQLETNASIDEFTSVVDRQVAKSCSFAISRYIRSQDIKNITFATCHYDIIEWLQPDWVFDTATGKLNARGAERRPEITLELLPCSSHVWSQFRNHHYLSADVNKSARCWVAVWDGLPVAFTAILAYPSGTVKNAWRGHRTVVFPEFQGLGIGVRVSDAIGTIVKSFGGRYFSKTSSQRMGEYRSASKLWKPTSKNEKRREDYSSGRITKESNYKHLHINRVCYSHEFIGQV